MLIGIGCPREQDQERDKDGSNWIEIPNKSLSNYRHYQAEDVEYDVVSVVDVKYVDCWESSIEDAVHHHTAFSKDCDRVSQQNNFLY